MTRAQRNKQKAGKALNVEQLKVKANNVLQKAIGSLPHLLRSIEAETKQQEARRALRDVKQAEAHDDSAMSYADAGSVPLTDELSGSLRTMRPKGSMLQTAVANMRATGEVTVIDRRKRRKSERRFAQKKVKWVAKYKYPS